MDAQRYWAENPGSFDLFEEQALELMGFAPENGYSRPSFRRRSESAAPTEPEALPAFIRSSLFRNSRRYVNPTYPQTEVLMFYVSPMPLVSLKPNVWVSFSRRSFLRKDLRARDEFERTRFLGSDHAIWSHLPRDYIYPKEIEPTEAQVNHSVCGSFGLENDEIQLNTLYRMSANFRAAVTASTNVAKLSSTTPRFQARLDFDKPNTSARLKLSSAESRVSVSILQKVFRGVTLASEFASRDGNGEAEFGARWTSVALTSDGFEPLAEAALRVRDSGDSLVSFVSSVPLPRFLVERSTALKFGGVLEAKVFPSAPKEREFRAIGAVQLKSVIGKLEHGGTPTLLKVTGASDEGVSVTAAARFFNRFAVALKFAPRSFGWLRAPDDSSNPIKLKLTVDL